MKNVFSVLVACALLMQACKSGNEVVSMDREVSINEDIEKYLIDNKIETNMQPDGLVDKTLLVSVDTLRILLRPGTTGSLVGLHHFINLKYLSITSGTYPVYSSHDGKDVYPNFKIPLDTLDLSKNKSVEFVDCSGLSTGGGISPLVSNLILGENTSLKRLICDNNVIKQLDLSKSTNLERLTLSNSLFLRTVLLCQNKNLSTFHGQLMDVKVSSSTQLENFRKNNPASKFELCL